MRRVIRLRRIFRLRGIIQGRRIICLRRIIRLRLGKIRLRRIILLREIIYLKRIIRLRRLIRVRRILRFKPRPNDRYMPTQHIATLLGATCCVRLATVSKNTCHGLLFYHLPNANLRPENFTAKRNNAFKTYHSSKTSNSFKTYYSSTTYKGTGKRGHIVADTLLLMMFLGRANAWDTKWMLCFHAAQTGKHLLRTQNVSEQNQKYFLCPGHKICVRNKCCAPGQTGKHLCRQQCVRNNVSSFTRALIRLSHMISLGRKESALTTVPSLL